MENATKSIAKKAIDTAMTVLGKKEPGQTIVKLDLASVPAVAALQKKDSELAVEKARLLREAAELSAALGSERIRDTVTEQAKSYLDTGKMEPRPSIAPSALADAQMRVAVVERAQRLNMDQLREARREASRDICKEMFPVWAAIKRKQALALAATAQAFHEELLLRIQLQAHGVEDSLPTLSGQTARPVRLQEMGQGQMGGQEKRLPVEPGSVVAYFLNDVAALGIDVKPVTRRPGNVAGAPENQT